jgi:hypothetical protein
MTDVATLYMSRKPMTLAEVQKFVDGYVELIWTKNGDQMLINEEGMYRDDLKPNPTATAIAIEAGYMVPKDGIRGNAVVLTGVAKWD